MNNRVIKFRAWDSHNKRWITDFHMTFSEWFGFSISGYGANIISHVELSQFTGLYDKNGVEIYEGDILADDELICGKVSYCDDARCIYAGSFYLADGFNFASDAPELEDCNKFLSVIGNIYKNPELME